MRVTNGFLAKLLSPLRDGITHFPGERLTHFRGERLWRAPQAGWHQVAKLVGSVGNIFGLSGALSGGTAVVGAPDHAHDAGQAYVFRLVVLTTPGSRSLHVWLAGTGVTSDAWSGPVPTAALVGTGGVPSPASDLTSFAAALARASGGERSWIFPSG